MADFEFPSQEEVERLRQATIESCRNQVQEICCAPVIISHKATVRTPSHAIVENYSGWH